MGIKWSFGVSGGPDSICLANILYQIREEKQIDFELIIAHVNHLIREEAGSDEEFVRRYAKERKIPFEAKEIPVQDIALSKKMGTEETRKRRKI